jgi:hypothetical protein
MELRAEDSALPRHDADQVAHRAVDRAAHWIARAAAVRTRHEKANRRRLARLLKGPAGLRVTTAPTDQSCAHPGRSPRHRRARLTGPARALAMRDPLRLQVMAKLAGVGPAPAMRRSLGPVPPATRTQEPSPSAAC